MAIEARPEGTGVVLRGCRGRRPAWVALAILAGLPLAATPLAAGEPCPGCGPLWTPEWKVLPPEALERRDAVPSVLARPARPKQLDSLQQAVVDSLAAETRDTAPRMLDAAIRAADVEADRAALGWFERVIETVADAGDERPTMLADLGDSADQAALLRLARRLAPLDPDAPKLIEAMREAARERRADPARMARAAADLDDDSAAVREAALAELARARLDALPALVDLLGTSDPGHSVGRALARELVADMGKDARGPLQAILASPDTARWQGAIAALEAGGSADVADAFLAPALVGGTPPGAQRAALSALRRHAARLADVPDPELFGPPSNGAAVALVADRLDCILSPAGVPHVPADREEGPATVRRWRWNAQARRAEPIDVTPRFARSMDAAHVARDLEALDPHDPDTLRLVLLARVESLLLAAGPGFDALHDVPPERLAAAFTGPEGLDPGMVTDVLDEAIRREMPEVALAAVWQLEAMHSPQGSTAPAPLPPQARKSLVRLVDAPDARLSFAAARTLALVGGDAPFPGSSRMVERLLHAATSRGTDHAVVAHPDLAVANSLAAQASRYGFRTTVVGSGHEALRAAREDADTALVLLGARLARPGAFETLQGLRQAGRGDIVPTMIVVDPLDDQGRGCLLTQLVLQARSHRCVAIVDRLPSFWEPTLDDAGNPVRAPRFPTELAGIAGPEQADPAWRRARGAERLERARQALELLALLGHSGHDVAAVEETARLALATPTLAPAALKALAVVGRPGAQGALVRRALAEEDPALRALALASLEENVHRHGPLLDPAEMADLCRSYNSDPVATHRDTAAAILASLPRRAPPVVRPPVDAAAFRPNR